MAQRNPRMFSDPRHTKAALAARPDGVGGDEQGAHRGGVGCGMAASVAGRGDVGEVLAAYTEKFGRSGGERDRPKAEIKPT